MTLSDSDIVLLVTTGSLLIIGSITVIVGKFVLNKPTDYSLKKGSLKIVPLILFGNIMIMSKLRQNHSTSHTDPIIVVLVTAAVILFLDKLLPLLISFCRRKIGKNPSPR